MKLDLNACQNCNHIDYEFANNAKDIAGALLEGVSWSSIRDVVGEGGIGGLLGNGGGLFAMPKLFYQGVFEGRDGHPLLRCRHCYQLTVCCKKCGHYMLLERRPKVAELIKCPSCKFAFQACETNNEFKELLATQTKI